MSTIDLALVGARVRTLDPEQPAAEAIAIAGGEIVAVGSDAEIREFGAAMETIDLHGAVAVPGLTDSHIHPLQGALDTRGADLRDLSSLEDVRDAVATERRSCAPDQWVLGFGLEYDVFRDSGIHGDLFEDVVDGSPPC
jgi:predicted amidohydrolase YtcJ